MRRVIWPFVVWLLALALPVQGLAAATMLHCAPSRDLAAAAAQDADHPTASTSRHVHHHDATTADPDAQASHAGHHADAAHDPEGADGASASLHKCSACAACCIGLALPSTAYALPQPLADTATVPAPAAQHVVFFTSGPERPPRAPLP